MNKIVVKKLIIITFGIIFALSIVLNTNYYIYVRLNNSNKTWEREIDLTSDINRLELSKASDKIHIKNNWSDAKF
ncbi:MAG: hypothetical protein ACFFDH_16165, partial [Promethearchaeota archaeon]